MRRRISAALLTLCMLMSLVPSVAFAAPNGTFDDVNDHWGKDAIERWAGYGVVNGDGSGSFAPDKQMTRAEFATMLANMLGYKEKAANTFADVNDSDWFADAILKLAAAGVMQGSNGMANPNAPITRQEAAVLMCRAFNIPTTGGNLDFADSADVADWAKGAVAALADRGMMNGVGNNNVAPLADINRASVATLLDNMITEYVTEDKTITGEVSGIVLVAADATVTVENATLNENLIVAPKADGAEVALTGTTTASDVVVGATATVKVESTASAGTVQMEAANSTVEVAGKADAVVVAESAEGAKANVTETAEVKDVTVAAPNAETQVAGKVESVAVAPTAEGAKANVTETAEVKDVTVAAPKAETQVAGKVETVSVAPTAEGAKANVAANAEVKDMTVAAPNTETQVAGKVENVTVTETAKNVTVNTSSGAQVGSVTTEAEGTTVSGSGKVDSVIATGNADNTSVTTSGTKTENKTESGTMTDGKGNETKPGESGTSSGTTTGGSGGGGGVTTTDVTTESGIIGVDPVDQASESKITDMPAITAKVEKRSNSDTLTIKLTTGTKSSGSVDAVPMHENANHEKGYWVGVAIPLPTNSEGESGGSVAARSEGSGYYYYFGATPYTSGNLTSLTAEPVPAENTATPADGTSYGVFWIDAGAAAPKTNIVIGTSAPDRNPTKYVVDLSGVKLAGTQEKAVGALDSRNEYTTAYTALGIGFTNSNGIGTLTVDEAKLLPNVFDNSYQVAHQENKMTNNNEVTDILAGVQFAIPENATMLDVTITGYESEHHQTGVVPDTTTEGFDSLAGLNVYVDGANAYLIDYVPVWDGSTGETITYAAPLTYRMVWTCTEGNTTITKIQTYTLNVNVTPMSGAASLSYVVNKVDNKVDIRGDSPKYICFQIAKSLDNGAVTETNRFPIKTGTVVAAARVIDGKAIPYKTWVTGENEPKDYDRRLELPASGMTSSSNSDYAHHVGLTLKMEDNAADQTWYFWTKEGNALTPYTVTIKADDLKQSTYTTNDEQETGGGGAGGGQASV